MNENPFDAFINFVQVDQEIEKNRLDLNKILQEQEVLQKKLDETKKMLQEARQTAHQLHREFDAQELEIKTLNQSLLFKKKRLEQISSPREYQSLHTEIENIQQKIGVIEDQALRLLQLFENAEIAYQDMIKNSENITKNITEQMEHKVRIAAQLKQTIEELILKKSELETKVVPEWLEKYNTMKTRIPNPVVPVINGRCSACFYPVSVSDLQALRKHKLLQCKDCYRFLYSK